jgi:DNA-binding LytR/AlgR family response regulator
LHLKAEEHYVAVTLREGRSLLLRGRLADAIAQLPLDQGMQVHRSHWVARAALAQVFRAQTGWRLRLDSGLEVPIARNRSADVRAWVETPCKKPPETPGGLADHC